MSRHFQSSYHGSNDYRKYREERLSKNVDTSIPQDKKSFAQDFSYRPESRRTITKEHLQTFGKQTNFEVSKNQNTSDELYPSLRQAEKFKRQQPSKYQGNSFLSKRGFSSQMDQIQNQDDKLSGYRNDRYGADIRPAHFNEQPKTSKAVAPQIAYTNLRVNSRPTDKYSRFNDTQRDNQVCEDFEDSIITRRRNYDSNNAYSNQTSEATFKNYNYSSKLRSKPQQNIDSNKFQLKPRKFINDTQFQNKHHISSDLLQKTSSTSPYRSRNQMIKERLNINAESRQDEYRNFKPSFDPIGQSLKAYETKRQYVPSQIKTVQVTPEKSPLTSRQDKNASEQRRKSLIQKSQMLKEKLNKLNGVSNTKAVQNEENCHVSKANQKQNIIQSYTPKRYMTNSFRVNHDESQQKDKSVSKKLNFDEATNRGQALRGVDRNVNEGRQSTRNYHTNSAKAPSQKEPLSVQVAGEGALRKISELNERINSRLESILKNYA